MITLGNFVGAMTEALVGARAMADNTSAQVAQKYLNHEYLKGFPVPRMALKAVDVELNFAVSSTSSLSNLLKQPEVAQNICHRFRNIVTELPQSDRFQTLFGQQNVNEEDWQRGTEALIASIRRVLDQQPKDTDSLVHYLVLAFENFFFHQHHIAPRSGLLAGLRRLFGGGGQERQDEAEEDGTDSTRDWIKQQVNGVLDATLPGGLKAVEEAPDLHVLVASGELQGSEAEKLHTAKLTFSPEDRKWVATEKNGEKTYILDR